MTENSDLERYQALLAENDRLKAALKIYADKSRWFESDEGQMCFKSFYMGWKEAEEALEENNE